MSDPAIPPGQMAFLETPTGFVAADSFPRAGIGLRPNGELLIIGGGEAFAARLTPDDLDMLARLCLAVASQMLGEAVQAADTDLERVVTQHAAGRA